MRRLLLRRDESTAQGTLGVLVVGARRLHTMEPPDRDNERNRSCIPVGRYAVRPHLSPRFGRCLAVPEVPGRSHILVHAGNVGGDTTCGYHTHTLGCILPGLRRGRLRARGRLQRAVLGSRTALRFLLAALEGEPAILEIES